MWFHTHSCIICRPTLDPILKEKLKSTCIICIRNFTMWLHKSVVIILATQLPWWRPRWWPSRLTATTLDERCADANIFPNIQPLTPIRIIVLPLSPFFICNGPWHPLYSTYVLDSPHVQPLSRSSLVFPLVLNPQLHAPYISSPSYRHLFATHDRTSADFHN